MDLQVTNTFDKNFVVFNDMLSKKEYAERCRKYIEMEIEQTPTWHRYRQIVDVGGSRSSKSYSILQILMILLMTKKNIKITVWRNLKNVCRSTVLEDFQKIIRFDDNVYKNFTHHKQQGSFTYEKTGSRIIFEGADNIGKVLGSTQDYSFFNEISEFNEEVYLQITQRTAQLVFCDYNPSKSFFLESYRKDEETKFIHSTFKDNIYCPANAAVRLLGYEPYKSGSYEIRGSELFYNDYPISPSNQPPIHEKNCYMETANLFMWMVYGLGLQAEKPNRIYKGWIEIDEDYFNELEYISYFGADFGAVNPTAFLEVKYDGDGAFYVYPRYYKPLNDIDASLPTIVHIKIPEIIKGKSLVVCDSAKDKYITSLRNAGYLAVGAVKGGGSVEWGITIVQGFTIYFVLTPEFLAEYHTYSWMLDRYGKPTDTPLKMDDHYMDALRYVITYLVRLLSIKL